MKEARCPACPEVFTDKTELGAMIKVVEHLKANPEADHAKFLDVRLAELERLIDKDDTASMKLALLDKCINLDERLRAIHLLAASTLSMAVDKILDLLIACEGHTSIRQANAAQSLIKNLREALLVTRRRFR
jgi:DNA-binding transcriptional ArsR family regulator